MRDPFARLCFSCPTEILVSKHHATITWERSGAAFVDDRYSRAHRWSFDGGASVIASSSPQVVAVPMSDPAGVDPEEAFIASLSSCHMLWFLALARKRGLVVDRYRDEAVGEMGRNAAGKPAITRVLLRPQVSFVGSAHADGDELRALHEAAHAQCYIANSVFSEIRCEPVLCAPRE
jgi:organic hydroperoxide reductase OsmC/OhrA